MTIAQSIRSPKRSKQEIRSRVKPLAGPGATPIRARQARLAQRLHPVPDHLAGVADPVRVVEEEQVERGGAEPPEAFLGRHPQVLGVGVGPAQRRVGEAREAARPVALALVEVVADGADQRVVLARDPGQRPAEHLVGLALAVGVGGEDGVDPVARAQQLLEALLVDRLAEAEKPAAAPGPDRTAARLAHGCEP